MRWEAVVARRLARHGLAAPLDGGPVGAVRAMVGAHAQVQVAGEISVALRLPGATRADVQAALADRTILKTYGPRGTVHFLPAGDLPMWTGALSAVPRQPLTVLTPDEAEEVVAGIGTALADATLTVDELTEALGDVVGAWAVERTMPAFQEFWPRWRQATSLAAHRGVLCFGPVRGRRVTYCSPGPVTPAPDGLRWLLGEYLRAYGPARPRDLAQWLAAPRAWAAEVFAAADVEDTGNGYVAAGDTTFPSEPPRGLRLLPYFDAYAVGSHPRERLYPGRAWDRALAGTQAGNFPVLLVDGTVAGVWHQKRSGRRVTITVEPLDAVARTTDLETEAARIATILGGTADLTVGPISVGAHA